MKKSILFFALIIFAFAEITNAQTKELKLLNKPMPVFEGVTLSGKKINKAYFKGKVTIVNFMFIGCMPCMKEIAILNKLHDTNSGKINFQVLGISANTAGQLNHFNAENDTTIYNRIRRVFKSHPISYDLMPECEKVKQKPVNSVGAECRNITKEFNINSYPYSFLIDKKGIIRKIYSGFPMNKEEMVVNKNGQITFAAENHDALISELQAEIDRLLKE